MELGWVSPPRCVSEQLWARSTVFLEKYFETQSILKLTLHSQIATYKMQVFSFLLQDLIAFSTKFA